MGFRVFVFWVLFLVNRCLLSVSHYFYKPLYSSHTQCAWCFNVDATASRHCCDDGYLRVPARKLALRTKFGIKPGFVVGD